MWTSGLYLALDLNLSPHQQTLRPLHGLDPLLDLIQGVSPKRNRDLD
jgi:hypothetical protein